MFKMKIKKNKHYSNKMRHRFLLHKLTCFFLKTLDVLCFRQNKVMPLVLLQYQKNYH